MINHTESGNMTTLALWRPRWSLMSWTALDQSREAWHHLISAPLGSSAIAFDPAVDLLWSGDHQGTVASFFPEGFARYTSCRAHKPVYTGCGSPGVLQILADEKGIFSLNRGSLQCTSRNGVGCWTYKSPQSNFVATSFSSARAADLVVSTPSSLTLVNASTGSPLRQVSWHSI